MVDSIGSVCSTGRYVYYSVDDLLAIVALESQHAGGIVIGEGLDTVEADVRTHLSNHHVLSYKVIWFEEQPLASYPKLSVVCTTTHDLSTVAGVWTGGDARLLSERGVSPDLARLDHMKQRLRQIRGLRIRWIMIR